jgi:hypothetical protein
VDQYFLLLRENESGKLIPITVTGANSPEAAIRMVESAAMSIVGFRDSHKSASQEATQLNTANGFVEGGCSTCG